VVISQVQITGTVANDEFVELYNPTNTAVDLLNWKLTRKTKTGTQSTLVDKISGSIAPHGYFLITSPESVANGSADKTYSTANRLAADNTVLLNDNTGLLIDKVGIGTALDIENAGFSPNPTKNQSIIRKATADSDETSLSSGGSEEHSGNGYDTDNNANDFILLSTSLPRNSHSQPAVTPTPTILPTATVMPSSTPTNEPTHTPSVAPTTTPTVLPTSTPVPTNVPTSTPTPTATQTPTPTVTPEPTEITPTATTTPEPTSSEETPTPTLTPSITPTVTPSPTPITGIILDEIVSPRFRLVCTQTVKTIKIFGHTFTIPQVHCELIKIKEQPKHHSNHDNDNNHR
jgi:hypothetical protein